MTDAPFTLRPARPDDAVAIAAFHVEVWRETYAGIAPPEVAARLDEPRRLAQWQAAFADGVTQVLLATDGNRILGLVSFGPASHPVFDGRGEVHHLYVARAARRTGLGAILLQAAFNGLTEQGFPAAGLAVVDQNHPARRFYAALGGRESGTFRDKGPLWPSRNILVTWDDLRP